MAKILIVEDNSDLAEEIEGWLLIDKHICELAANGKDALMLLGATSYDLMVLDWQLPDISGIDILREYRNSGNQVIAVLMLTGKSEIADKLLGLDSGADDYLTKPFKGEELIARVRALLRRSFGNPPKTLGFGDLELDPSSHNVTVNGKGLKLTGREFDCLMYMVQHSKSGPISPEALIMRVWSNMERASNDAVKTCVSQIRKKLQAAESSVSIQMRPRYGYELKQLAQDSKDEHEG